MADTERIWLRTGQCARVLGVSHHFIRWQIEDRRLRAIKIDRANGRPLIRIKVEDFRDYLERYSPESIIELQRFLDAEAA